MLLPVTAILTIAPVEPFTLVTIFGAKMFDAKVAPFVTHRLSVVNPKVNDGLEAKVAPFVTHRLSVVNPEGNDGLEAKVAPVDTYKLLAVRDAVIATAPVAVIPALLILPVEVIVVEAEIAPVTDTAEPARIASVYTVPAILFTATPLVLST
jgi:hypothetical protein